MLRKSIEAWCAYVRADLYLQQGRGSSCHLLARCQVHGNRCGRSYRGLVWLCGNRRAAALSVAFVGGWEATSASLIAVTSASLQKRVARTRQTCTLQQLLGVLVCGLQQLSGLAASTEQDTNLQCFSDQSCFLGWVCCCTPLFVVV